jgi:hypothetical protein
VINVAMLVGDIQHMHIGDQSEHQGRVQLRRALVRALRWCAADTHVADYAPLNPTDRRALRRLYRLASLRQPRGSMALAAAIDIWRGVVVESKRCSASIEEARDFRQKAWTGLLLQEWARHSSYRGRSQKGALQMQSALRTVTQARHFAGWAEFQGRHASEAILPSQAPALVPPAQDPPPPSTPSTPASASLQFTESSAALVGFLPTGSRTAMALVCHDAGIGRLNYTAEQSARMPWLL